MFDLGQLLIFITAGIMLNLTPGPDMLFIIGRSAGQGRRAGVISALGIGMGTVVHTLAAAFGLSALLLSSALGYEIVKYAGACYLIYLGLRLLLSREQQQNIVQKNNESSYGRIFFQAVITNVLNPKVALFFLAFLPQFVDPARGSVIIQFIILGMIFNINGTIWNLIVAFFAGYMDSLLKARKEYLQIQRWITGGIFLALGLRLALLERR